VPARRVPGSRPSTAVVTAAKLARVSLKTRAFSDEGRISGWRWPKRVALAAGLLAAALALGACGGGGAPASATQAAAAARTASATAPTPPVTTATAATTQAPAPTTEAGAPPPAKASRPPHAAQQSGATAHPIREVARLALDHKFSFAHYTEKGTITGTFDGTMTLDARAATNGIVVAFTAQLPGGSVSGHGRAILQLNGAALDPLTGTAAITAGTGAFAHAHAKGLKVAGKAALDGSRAVVSLAGTVMY
jgi:hypothetical protein